MIAGLPLALVGRHRRLIPPSALVLGVECEPDGRAGASESETTVESEAAAVPEESRYEACWPPGASTTSLMRYSTDVA